MSMDIPWIPRDFNGSQGIPGEKQFLPEAKPNLGRRAEGTGGATDPLIKEKKIEIVSNKYTHTPIYIYIYTDIHIYTNIYTHIDIDVDIDIDI